MVIDYTSGIIANPAKQYNAIKQKIIDQQIARVVMKTNHDIFDLFKSLGMDYVPFMLSYHQSRVRGKYHDYDPTKTPYKSGNIGANLATSEASSSSAQQGQGEQAVEGDIWKNIKNISLDVDKDFLGYYFKDKVDYNLWLSRKYPELQRQSWWALRNNDDPPPDYVTKKKEYFKEMGDKAIDPFEGSNVISGRNKYGDWSKTITGKSNVVGYVQSRPTGEFNSAIRGGERYGAKNWKAFTTRDVQKFAENEGFLFKGNLQRFLSVADDKVVKVLMDVLEQFQEELLNLDLNDFEVDETTTLKDRKIEPKEYEGQTNSAEVLRKGVGERQKKFLQETEDFKGIWKPEPKFPNITNIRTWFLKKGIYNSRDFDDFLDKTPKGKANWIDRSVFLIANGVYAKALGQKTFRMSADYADRPVPFKKGIRAGKAAYISKARRYKRFSNDRQKANTQRQQDYEVWKAENATVGRGWNNRYNKGKSPKPKKDSPRYDWRLGK